MKFDCTINIVDFLTLISSIAIFIIGLRLSSKVSAKQKFEHEKEITNYIRKNINFGSQIILADVKKYHKDDSYNETSRKQLVEFYNIVPNSGIQVFYPLGGHEGQLYLGLIPFEWIEYIRDNDSEDNKFIMVCKFIGSKRFSSKNKKPFKYFYKIYKNKNYSSTDPQIFKFSYYENKPKPSN